MHFILAHGCHFTCKTITDCPISELLCYGGIARKENTSPPLLLKQENFTGWLLFACGAALINIVNFFQNSSLVAGYCSVPLLHAPITVQEMVWKYIMRQRCFKFFMVKHSQNLWCTWTVRSKVNGSWKGFCKAGWGLEKKDCKEDFHHNLSRWQKVGKGWELLHGDGTCPWQLFHGGGCSRYQVSRNQLGCWHKHSPNSYFLWSFGTRDRNTIHNVSRICSLST